MEDLVPLAMAECFGKTPYPWQKTVASHLLGKIQQERPGTVLCVRPTGGGKSAVRDVVGCFFCGVTLTICPLVTLGANQTKKLNGVRDDHESAGIGAVHLDDVLMRPDQVKELNQYLLSLPTLTERTIYLFSSPQAITSESSPFQATLLKLNERHLLRLICVDDVHLFVQCGLRLRSEFQALKTVLFEHCPHVPSLLLTGTATKETLSHFEELSGMQVDREMDVFWPEPASMSRRQVRIEVSYKTHTDRSIIKKIGEMLRECVEGRIIKKCIVYTNLQTRVEYLSETIKDFLDSEGLPGDVVDVHEGHRKEEQCHRILVFQRQDEDDSIQSNPFRPRILVATPGCVNAGLDCSDVYLVLRDGMPPSVLDLAQELGRAGRRPSASPKDDAYTIFFSLESFVSLVERVYRDETDGDGNKKGALHQVLSHEAYRNDNLRALMDVLRMLVLGSDCLHVLLQTWAGNPFSPITSAHELSDCDNSCFRCTDRKVDDKSKRSLYFPPVRKQGVSEVLIALFAIGEGKKLDLADDLPTALSNVASSMNRLFDINSTAPVSPRLSKMLLLQLLAAGILEVTCQDDDVAKDKKHIRCQLSIDPEDRSKLFMSNEKAWIGIACSAS